MCMYNLFPWWYCQHAPTCLSSDLNLLCVLLYSFMRTRIGPNITLGWGRLQEVDNNSMRTHTGPTLGLRQVDNSYMGLHTGPNITLGWGLRQVDNSYMGLHTGPNITLGWGLRQVDNSSVSRHAGSSSHWAEGWGRLTIALWVDTLGHHHTGLRVEAGWQ